MNVGFNVVLYIVFGFSFLKIMRERAFRSAVFLCVLYPTIAAAAGQETLKAVISVVLIALCVAFSFISDNNTNARVIHTEGRCNASIPVLIMVVTLSLYVSILALVSPASGTDYLTRKFQFFLISTAIPCVLLLVMKDELDGASTISGLLIWSSFILSLKQIYMLYDFGISNYFTAAWLPRLTEEGLNTIWLGRYLGMGLIISFQKALHDTNILRTGVVIIILVGILLTGSKAALFYSGTGVLLLLIPSLRRSFSVKKLLRGSATIVLIALASMVFLSSVNSLAFQRRFSTVSTTIPYRLWSVQEVLNSWKVSDNPLIGRGYATVGESLSGAFQREYPHNITVELLYELGLLGTILYYSFFMILLVALNREQLLIDRYFTYIILIIVFLLHAQTSGDLMSNEMPLVLVALVCGSNTMKRKTCERGTSRSKMRRYISG